MEAASPPLEREILLRRLLDQVPALIWHCGPDRRCRYANQAWLAFTGCGTGDDPGAGWLDRVHPDDRNGYVASLEAAIAAGEPFKIEFRLRRHDGVYRWVSDNGRPFVDGSGAFAGYACCVVEIHRHRRMRRTLERALRLVHNQRMLLAELRHRAKNTVQLIGSLLSLLARQVTEASIPAVQEMARRVRALGLAHEALDHSSRTGAVDLGAYLSELASGLLEVGRARGIRLETKMEPDLLLPINRAVPLGLVVNELMTNALKHSFPGEQGGSITLEVRRMADGRIEVTVSDNGVGLPEGAWPPTSTRRLGLPLVAGLARQAGAEITVTTSGGTRFSLALAATADRRPASEATGSPPPAAHFAATASRAEA